ncbi:hypothetical protein DID88_010398 [Monilinia fructigena]|uniref:Major facilitator superfamily (MFS) profile domain-containing protein n=1 Tax=Monilinia fructigena TaxID=38457 RepID=A0A395ILB0_9HELO|nr:hypothetical protein DID88_010398 [Monilinia fructigena]
MASKKTTSVIITGDRKSTATPTYENGATSSDNFEPGNIDKGNGQLHYVPRGQEIAGAGLSTDSITGYEAEQMQARASLSFEEEKKLLRRIDWHLMPLLSICFLLKNIDASNVSNVRIMNTGTDQNILKELGMSSNEFNFVSTIYYMPYIIAEAPSNLFVKRLLPSKWQSRIMITWGMTLCCHAAVKNKQSLYVARFFLGLLEAGLFPGVILQLCYWYRPDEMSRRLLYFYMLGNFSTVISGVLAYAFNGVSGYSGLSGWQWVFLIEGLVTVIFGIFLKFLLPDWPWRVQTTSRATGSAFSIGFVNSYGQIGGALGPQIFRSQYAPHYVVSFAIAMALVGFAIVMNLVTWWVTRRVERETRVLKLERIRAGERGETVLEDVDIGESESKSKEKGARKRVERKEEKGSEEMV